MRFLPWIHDREMTYNVQTFVLLSRTDPFLVTGASERSYIRSRPFPHVRPTYRITDPLLSSIRVEKDDMRKLKMSC